MARILVPLPDNDFDVTEVSVPWKLLTRAGHSVSFATENALTPQGDPLLLTGVIFGQLGAEPEAKAFYSELTRSAEFQKPIKYADIRPADYNALLLPGGHAPGMRQYLASQELQSKVAQFWKTDKPVAAICHGVLVLARSRDPETGRSVLSKIRTTCLPKFMERTAYYLTAWKLGKYYRTYPAYVEDEVRGELENPRDQFQRGPLSLIGKGTDTDDRHAFVVEDGRYVSGRWPGDAYLLAKRLMARL
ncbi:MAG: DJ-1/PfpI family protein [Polyangiaceae bacterium]|nr:DJ-1/PfpI family protein [Polyangiaceae bacterium]